MFLMKHGFSAIHTDKNLVLERNGEIHFFETYGVSQETFENIFKSGEYISPKRYSQISKRAQLFMREIGAPNKIWHLHVINVIYSKNNKVKNIKFLWDFNF